MKSTVAKYRFVTTLFLFASLLAISQPVMRPLKELIVNKDSTWKMVRTWIQQGENAVELLPKNDQAADSVLLNTQVTTHSPMGAIIYETGGILIDSGWIRILGSGSDRMRRNVMDWNKGKSFKVSGERPAFLLIADDVLGGFFAINSGGLDSLPATIGKLFYFAPDNLNWENLDLTYTEFLHFCFSGNLKEFYADYRWANWKKEVARLDGDTGFNFYPPLWSKEGKSITLDKRTLVPMQELWDVQMLSLKKITK